MKTVIFFSLATLNNASILSTVLFAVTLSPTTPQVTPSGLKKSFCGSVITMAVFASTLNPGSGSWAKLAVKLTTIIATGWYYPFLGPRLVIS